MEKQKVKCPRRGRRVDRLLALSRRDNKTMICDECGMQEAMEDFARYAKPATLKMDTEEIKMCDRSKNI